MVTGTNIHYDHGNCTKEEKNTFKQNKAKKSLEQEKY